MSLTAPGPIDYRVIAHGTPAYRETVSLRYRILREPLGLSFTDEQLAGEATDMHITATQDGRLLGCLVLTPREQGVVQMRQVAVDPNVQGQGIGRGLVTTSEDVARGRGFTTMILHARESAVPFYLRLNYEVVGEPYEEVTLPHLTMEKRLF